MSHTVLTDPEFSVPPVPDSPPGGVTWLRPSVARFSSGTVHRRRRAPAVAALASVDPGSLRLRAAERGDGPVEVLAEALGLPADIADEATANRIGVLVQACDATKARVADTVPGRPDPPVP